MKKEKLEEFNEWWFTNKVPEDLLEKYKRKIFYKIIKYMTKRQIISIVGLRRTGKTVVIYQIIQELIKNKIDPKNILYFSFDENIKDLEDVLNTYREIQKKDFRKNKIFIFLDELQKLKNWQNQIKKYYDLYPKIKFVVSGSESLFIRKKAKETLAGRIYEFFMPTLSFKEFLELKEQTKIPEIKTKMLFREYMEKGGFPEIVNESNLNEIRRYIKSTVIDKIIFKDILIISGIKDVDTLNTLLEIIASNPGMQLEYQSLSQQLGKDRRVIKEYIMWLKEAFLIRILRNYRKGKIASLRKTKRAYIMDNGIITAFKPQIDEAFFGKMVENYTINFLNAENFWKNRFDVDCVVNDIPIEIKYQPKIIKNDLKGLRSFMKKFNVKKAILLTKNEERIITVKEGKIKLIQIWKFILD